MTQAVNDTKNPYATLATYFPQDEQTDERIKNIDETLRKIPEKYHKHITDRAICFVTLYHNKVDYKTFKTAQKVLFRSTIDTFLQDRNELLKTLVHTRSVFTNIIIEEIKPHSNLVDLLGEMKASRSYTLIALCMTWADTRQELEVYLHKVEELCEITLFQTLDGKKSLDLIKLAELSFSFSQVPAIADKSFFSTEEIIIFLKCSVNYRRFAVFEDFCFLALDPCLHCTLLLDLAEIAVAKELEDITYVHRTIHFHIESFWINIPLSPKEKERLFDCFYHSKKGRAELIEHIEYFGWDLSKNKEDIFQLLKETTEVTVIPDYRRFTFSADQRWEIAKGYAKLIEQPQCYYDANFFTYLPLQDLDNDRLFPLLQQFTKMPAMGKHLHEFSLTKEQKIELIKQCSLQSNDILPYLTKLGLDPVQDAPLILAILANVSTFLLNPQELQPIFSYFAFSVEEKGTILKILAEELGIPLLHFLGQLGLGGAEHSGMIFEIAILCFTKMADDSLDLSALTSIFKKLKLSFTQNIALLKLFIQNQTLDKVDKDFDKLLREIGLETEKNREQIYSLFDLAFKSSFKSNKPLIFKQIRQFSFAEEQIWSLAKACVTFHGQKDALDVLDCLKEWKMDGEDNQSHQFEIFLLLATRWPDEILKRRDFSLTSAQKRSVFDCCSTFMPKTLLDDDNLKFWLEKEDALDKQSAYNFIKMGVVSIPQTIAFLSTFSFTRDERKEILVHCHQVNMKSALDNIYHFKLTEAEHINVFESVFDTNSFIGICDKSIFEWIIEFPIPKANKIKLLLALANSNFQKCLDTLDKLGLDDELMQKTLFALFSQVLQHTYIFYSIKNIQRMLSLHKKYHCTKELALLYLPNLFKNETIWVIEHLAEFGLDLYQDCEEMILSLKQSKCLINNLAVVLKKLPLTKKQQAGLLLQQAPILRQMPKDCEHFLEALLGSALTVEEDRVKWSG